MNVFLSGFYRYVRDYLIKRNLTPYAPNFILHGCRPLFPIGLF